MKNVRIEQVGIEQTRGCFKQTWFADLICPDGSFSNITCADSKGELLEALKYVRIIPGGIHGLTWVQDSTINQRG